MLAQRQVAYYINLAEQGKIGKGFFDENLANLHDGIDLLAERAYYAEPKSLSLIESDIMLTPDQHPLRAIAYILKEAPENSTIRVSAYRLTDLAAIDLLVQAGACREVKSYFILVRQMKMGFRTLSLPSEKLDGQRCWNMWRSDWQTSPEARANQTNRVCT